MTVKKIVCREWLHGARLDKERTFPSNAQQCWLLICLTTLLVTDHNSSPILINTALPDKGTLARAALSEHSKES